MNLTNSTISILIIIGLISCKEKESNESYIHPTKITSEFKDSIFFSSIYGMKYFSDYIFLTDMNKNVVYKTDKHLKLISLMGKYGEGPGEMTYCMKVDVNKNFVFAGDDGNRRINIFNKKDGSYFSSFKTNYSGYNIITRFAVSQDNTIFISSNKKVYSVDLYGNLINEFNLKTASYWTNETSSNYRDIFIFNNKTLLLVPHIEPFIETYTLSGDMIYRFDLSGLLCLQNLILFIKEGNLPTETSYYEIFQDSYLVGNHLFILYLDIDKTGKKSQGNILELDISKKPFKLKNIYHLLRNDNKIGWFNSFCVSDDRKKLYAYEGALHEIHIFNLDK